MTATATAVAPEERLDVLVLRAWDSIDAAHPFAEVDPARVRVPAGVPWVRPMPQNHFEQGSGFFTGLQKLSGPFSDLSVEDDDDDDELASPAAVASASASAARRSTRSNSVIRRVELHRRAQSLMASGAEFIGDRHDVGAASKMMGAASQQQQQQQRARPGSLAGDSFARGSDLSNFNGMLDDDERYTFLSNLRTIPHMPATVKLPRLSSSSSSSSSPLGDQPQQQQQEASTTITANSLFDAFSAAALISQLDDEEETMARETRRMAANRAAKAAAIEEEQKAMQSGAIVGLLRSAVSMNKLRFQQDGFDLDLTYITPRIIAMGFPSSGAESLYRNPLPEVELFFKKRHPNGYRIYNLCSERTYPDPKSLEGRHKRFPFDDHNAPCPVKLIPALVKDATQFLQEDSRNVCALHCKAGKGRTGVMISCLLMAVVPSLRSPMAALSFFGSQRAEDGFGVTIASQVRYVRYWGDMLRLYKGEDPQPQRTLSLQRLVIWSTIKMNAAPMDSIFLVVEVNGEKKLDTSETTLMKPFRASDAAHGVNEPHYVFERPGRAPLMSTITGDVRITVYTKTMLGGKDELFHYWFNTTLCNPQFEAFGKFELDKACKDKKNHVYCLDLVAQTIFIDAPLKRPQVGPQMAPELMIAAAGAAAASAVSDGGGGGDKRGNSPPQPPTSSAPASPSARPATSSTQQQQQQDQQQGGGGGGAEGDKEKGLFARLFGK